MVGPDRFLTVFSIPAESTPLAANLSVFIGFECSCVILNRSDGPRSLVGGESVRGKDLSVVEGCSPSVGMVLALWWMSPFYGKGLGDGPRVSEGGAIGLDRQ